MSYVFMMESTYHDLADRALELLKKSHNYRVVILLIGAPGSGKTTVAQRVADILNKKFTNEGSIVDKTFTQPLDNIIERMKNGDLRKFNEGDPVDYEDESYKPTVEVLDHDVIIRGRGGDDTAIKISLDTHKDEAEEDDYLAQVIPMDGFHLPRSILRKFEDSEYAVKRRGSPFTFDSSLIVKLVENLNETLKIQVDEDFSELSIVKGQLPNIYIPSFDHAEHDPKQFGTKIQSSSRIVIMEGLYLLLNNPIWSDIAKNLNPDVEIEDSSDIEHLIQSGKNESIKDIPVPEGKNSEFWKILINDSKMLYRVGKRHLKAGIVSTLEDGEERVKVNDLPNGQKVYSESFKSDLNIISIDDINER